EDGVEGSHHRPGAQLSGRAHDQRDLLEEDDDPDPGGEPGDDRPRDQADELPQPEEPGEEQDDPGDDADEGHRADAVLTDDRHEDHGQRPGGSGHLDVRASEDSGDDPGDDRGDEPGRGPHAGADSEGQGQRERDDADGGPGGDVTPPGVAEVGVVG